MTMPYQVGDYLVHRATAMRRASQGRSPRQEAKIRESMAANMERASTSGTFRAIDADVTRFGADRVFSMEDEEPEAGKPK